MSRPPLPPFDHDSAVQKVRLAEDGWNSRDPARVALAYTEDSVWRNRSTFVTGRAAIVDFLTAKWRREHDYRLVKGLWAFTEKVRRRDLGRTRGRTRRDLRLRRWPER